MGTRPGESRRGTPVSFVPMSTDHHAAYWARGLSVAGEAGSVGSLSRSISRAKVDLNPHQVDAALFAVRSPFSRGVILADEVGLGKTIEAGIVLTQRWAERRRRVLLVVPATLRKQWQGRARREVRGPVGRPRRTRAPGRPRRRRPEPARPRRRGRRRVVPVRGPPRRPRPAGALGPRRVRRGPPAPERVADRQQAGRGDQGGHGPRAEAAPHGHPAPELAPRAVRARLGPRRPRLRRPRLVPGPVRRGRRPGRPRRGPSASGWPRTSPGPSGARSSSTSGSPGASR